MEAKTMKCINNILDRLPTVVYTVNPESPAYDASKEPQTKWLSEATTPAMMVGDETLYYLL